MTKSEQEYKRLLARRKELERRIDEKKEELDRERDTIVVRALRESHITREEGCKLARLIGDERMFAKIMELVPELEERISKKRRSQKEEKQMEGENA